MADVKDFLKYALMTIGIAGIGNAALSQNVPSEPVQEPPAIVEEKKESLEDKLLPFYLEMDEKFGLKDGEYALILDGRHQKLYLVSSTGDALSVHKSYDVSTGAGGFGSTKNANKTPLGIHKISDKYGEGAPYGGIFKYGIYLRRIAKIKPGKNIPGKALVTSRILRLQGMEESNSNTHLRNIYFHGTSREGSLGLPRSDGCIRMRNSDVMELFDLVKRGTYVHITQSLY